MTRFFATIVLALSGVGTALAAGATYDDEDPFHERERISRKHGAQDVWGRLREAAHGLQRRRQLLPLYARSRRLDVGCRCRANGTGLGRLDAARCRVPQVRIRGAQ